MIVGISPDDDESGSGRGVERAVHRTDSRSLSCPVQTGKFEILAVGMLLLCRRSPRAYIAVFSRVLTCEDEKNARYGLKFTFFCLCGQLTH